MPDVCLIRTAIVGPKGSLNNEPSPPIGLAYIAAALRENNFSVVGIDGVSKGVGKSSESSCGNFQIHGLSNEEILNLIPEDVKVIGVSVMFTHEWIHARDCIKLIKIKFPDKIIVIGGEHASGLPEYTLRDCSEIDYCVVGEGEETFLELLSGLFSGKKDVTGIMGIAYLDENNRYVESGKRNRIKNLDSIVWPDWNVFDIKPYLDDGISYGASFGRNMPIMASRGCPYKCTFCSNSNMWGVKYKLRNVEDVVNEIKHYIHKYNIDGLQFTDLTAIVKKKWVIDFINCLKKEKISLKWSLPSGTRSEALDEEVLNGMKDVGLGYLVYAPESGSSRMLALIKKKIDLTDMTRSIKKAIKLKIPLRANFIIGFPGEKRTDIYKTMYYAYYYSIIGVDEAPLYLYQPYPGSEMFNELVDGGEVVMNDDYINSLVTLSSGNLKPPKKVYSGCAGRYEIYFYRIISMVLTYSISYLFHPNRIIRTINNIKAGKSSTVFEERLKSLFK